MSALADVTLRPATDGDRALLARVYASTREQELALLPWDEQAKTAFLEQQFAAQRAHFAAHYAGADDSIVQVSGVDAGRFAVLRGERDIRLVDIALLPELRGSGVGDKLLTGLLAEADATGRTVSLHVAPGRPAQRWYERRGFIVVGDQSGDHLMQRQPNTAS